MIVKCIKSLYKSTYRKNAFTKGKSYEIASQDSQFFLVKDNADSLFHFSKQKSSSFYFIEDYFKVQGST